MKVIQKPNEKYNLSFFLNKRRYDTGYSHQNVAPFYALSGIKAFWPPSASTAWQFDFIIQHDKFGRETWFYTQIDIQVKLAS